MSSSVSYRNISLFILGGLAIVGFAKFLGFFSLFDWKKKSLVANRQTKVDESAGKSAKDDADDVVIEDADDDEDEESGDGDEEDDDEKKKLDASTAAMKDAFDTAIRLAKKLYDGQRYAPAAEKYTEAINIAQKGYGLGNQVTLLYNNRSAMYEKNGDLDASLSDITVVLAMEPAHVKARLRRARILEAKNQKREALKEYAMCQLIEQFHSGGQGPPPAYLPQLEMLMRDLAVAHATRVMASVRDTRSTLPGKIYCRNFLECFPSIHTWREELKNKTDRARPDQQSASEIAASLSDVLTKGFEGGGEEVDAAVSALLQVVYPRLWRDFVHGSLDDWTAAFDTVRALLVVLEPAVDTRGESGLHSVPLWTARLLQLRSAEGMLRARVDDAEKDLRRALELCPPGGGGDVGSCGRESVLILCTALLEQNKSVHEVESLLSELLVVSQDPGVVQEEEERCRWSAWTHIHLASVKTKKDDKGKYRVGSTAEGLKHVQTALAVTEGCTTGAMASTRIIALHRATTLSISVSVMEKAQLGYQEPPSLEELETAREWLREATKLAKSSGSSAVLCTILQHEAELALSTGDADAALLLSERAVTLAEEDDSVPLVSKATVVLQAAMMNPEDPTSFKLKLDAAVAEVKDLFNEALKIEPNGVEALAQMAHLLTMTGENERAITVLQRALLHVRSLEEAIDMSQMLVGMEAQAEAVRELQKSDGN